jgi:hypothetical protein
MMKPTHPVELLACAIATQEGWFTAGTMPSRLSNPGDIRFAGQANAQRDPSGFAKFSSGPAGITALFRQLWLQVSTGQTVREIVYAWAPPSENNTAAYLANVLKWTGLDADVPVLQLLPPLQQINQAVT